MKRRYGLYITILAACVWWCAAVKDRAVSASKTEVSEPLEAIVELIEQGRWESADALLSRQPADANELLAPVRDLLGQYHAMQQERSQTQQAIYDEQAEALRRLYERGAGGDPNVTNQKIFLQAYKVWKDATPLQQTQLLENPALQARLDETYQKGQRLYQQGKYAKAYRDSVRWLLVFEPENADYQALSDQIEQVTDVEIFLRKDPCDETNCRYVDVQLETIIRIFQILQACYVEPVNFYEMAKTMIQRISLLAEIMKTDAENRLYQADPNDCLAWSSNLEQFSADLQKQTAGDFDMRDFLSVLEVVLMINDQTLALPRGVMLSLATDSALAELDHYTVVVWPSNIGDFDKLITGQFGGVGFCLGRDKDAIKVISLIPDTPASRSDLRAETRILAVDGESTEAMSTLCAVHKISGPVGTPVTLTVQYPDSEQPEQLTIIRDKIVIPTVEGSRQSQNTGKPEKAERSDEEKWDYFLSRQDRIGYLRLSNFTGGTITQVHTVLHDLETAGLAGLIVDLRGNGGGLLTAATEISDMFISDGLLLESRGRANNRTRWKAHKDTVQRSYPMVVLIDGASASASEIVAGVLGHQGYHRAVLVGDRSFGKGSVQEVMSLGNDQGRLKFTAAHYYLPNGSPVRSHDTVERQGGDDWGIAPDVRVPLYHFEIRQIRKVSQQRRVVSASAEAEDDGDEKNDPVLFNERMIAVDPQLQTAMIVLKARMAAERALNEP